MTEALVGNRSFHIYGFKVRRKLRLSLVGFFPCIGLKSSEEALIELCEDDGWISLKSEIGDSWKRCAGDHWLVRLCSSQRTT